MANATVIDALFCLPKKGSVTQVSDCVPFTEDLGPRMVAGGISGALVAHGNCGQCQYQWNCADRRTHEVIDTVARNPGRLRGLADYDCLRIGESLRWIDQAVIQGGVAGAYVPAESCVSGLDAARMYPLYGLCAKLQVPVVIEFENREYWIRQRPQVEVVAADFPELDILLATPPGAAGAGILRLMQRSQRIASLLSPLELQCDAALCEYVELQGRERTLFRASVLDWPEAVKMASGLVLSPEAKRAYLSENAVRLFNFPTAGAGT